MISRMGDGGLKLLGWLGGAVIVLTVIGCVVAVVNVSAGDDDESAAADAVGAGIDVARAFADSALDAADDAAQHGDELPSNVAWADSTAPAATHVDDVTPPPVLAQHADNVTPTLGIARHADEAEHVGMLLPAAGVADDVALGGRALSHVDEGADALKVVGRGWKFLAALGAGVVGLGAFVLRKLGG
ncbi:MAG: hypothetical protein AAF656_13655 [Planctomycetota bacterium]